MYRVIYLSKIKAFEWNKGNLDKSYQKHGITPNESEEVFLDENLKVVKDFKHSQTEERFIALSKTFKGKSLFVVFTIRKNEIRVVSARKSNLKERRKYEQKVKKNPQV